MQCIIKLKILKLVKIKGKDEMNWSLFDPKHWYLNQHLSTIKATIEKLEIRHQNSRVRIVLDRDEVRIYYDEELSKFKFKGHYLVKCKYKSRHL